MDTRDKWYLGSMNDATFIIDKPPSPSGTDVGPHFSESGPKPISAAIDDRNGKLIVEAHNAAIDAERARCDAIVQAARRGEIDQDLRSISYRIKSGRPFPADA